MTKSIKQVGVAAKGIIGSALAAILLDQAIHTASKRESMKDTLKSLTTFSMDDLNQFRFDLSDTLDSYKAIAKAQEVAFTTYRQNNSEADCVQVTVSLWRKMADAVENGFKPNYDLPWAELSALATAINKQEPVAGKTKQESVEEAEVEVKSHTRAKSSTVKLTPMQAAKAAFDMMVPSDRAIFMKWCANECDPTLSIVPTVKVTSGVVANTLAVMAKAKSVVKASAPARAV